MSANTNVTHLKSWAERFISESPPVIPPGEYDLRFAFYETRTMFRNSPKVLAWFDILDYGPYFGTRLARYYNAERLTGKSAKNGAFKVRPRSDLMREYVILFNEKCRRDRVPLSRYESVIITGRAETVITDSSQRPLPELLQYSVIRELTDARRL